MKIGVTQIILGNMSVDETIDLCQVAGYEAVELTVREGTDLHPDLSESELKSISAKFSAANIEIGSIAGLKGNLLTLDNKERNEGKQALAQLQAPSKTLILTKMLTLAKRLGKQEQTDAGMTQAPPHVQMLSEKQS